MTSTTDAPPPDTPAVAAAADGGDDPLDRAVGDAIDDAVRLLGAVRLAVAEFDLTTPERARTLARLEDYSGDLQSLLEWLENEG